METLDDLGYPKNQELVKPDEEVRFCVSYPLRHKTTLHCAKQNANCLVNGQYSIFEIVNFVLFSVSSVSTW